MQAWRNDIAGMFGSCERIKKNMVYESEGSRAKMKLKSNGGAGTTLSYTILYCGNQLAT